MQHNLSTDQYLKNMNKKIDMNQERYLFLKKEEKYILHDSMDEW